MQQTFHDNTWRDMAISSKASTSKKEIKFVDSAPTETRSVEDAIRTLQEGSDLWKVKSFTSWYQRKYLYNKDTQSITYEGSKKMSDAEIIDLHEIHDVRRGWRTDTFNKIAQQLDREKPTSPDRKPELRENCCFSIVYGPDHRTLDLLCPNDKICNSWVLGLNHLIAINKSTQRNDLYQKLKDIFDKADVRKAHFLTLDEILGVLKHLNIEMDREHAKALFNEATTSKKTLKGVPVLDADEFTTFYALLKKRPELEELFFKYSHGEEVLNASQLVAFLKNEQKMQNIDENGAADIIDIHEPTQARADCFLSLEGFQSLLMSDLMDIFNVLHRKVYQDMKHPLSSYYIASSHNTYLMANQLAGESSVEGYIRALKMGCRLDLWDGHDNEPIIYHGYTLTSKILLKDVLTDAIKAYAFVASDYPVILSLENHLCVEQQKVLANHLTIILGDLLYTETVNELSDLPSPFKLRRKIIIKNKKISEKHKEDETVSQDSEDDEEGQPSSSFTEDLDESTSSSLGRRESSERKKSSWLPWKKKRKKSGRVKLATELSDLVNICVAVHFQDFDHSRKHGKWYEMSSLTESKAYNLAATQPTSYVEYTRKQLMRIYPAGRRQDSSNYDPIPLWNVGCQMVALNYQTPGKPMTYNNAKFMDNGNCGYVLKPGFLIKGLYDHDMVISGVLFRTIFTIKIISGQHIPRPNQSSKSEIIDPYITVKVKGHEVDEKSYKTKVVRNNGFNPVWNEVFSFLIKIPQLAFVHFTVRDFNVTGRNEKLAEFCLPFQSVEEGYRQIHLVDRFQRPLIPASLFVHVTIA